MQKHYIKIKRAKTAIVMMSGFLLLLFSVTFLFPPANTPNKASAAPVTSSSSINIQTIRNLGGITLDVKSQNGTFTASTSEQEAEFAVSTTNLTGYRLYLEGDNSSNDLVDSDSGKILHSIANPTSLINFSSDTSYNNLWGIRPSKYNSHANTDFLPGPTLGESGQIPMDETTSATTGDPTHYTIGIGVRANYDDNVGNYKDTYKLVAVANPIYYTIYYKSNITDGSVQTNTLPDPQSGTKRDEDANTITLSSQTPKRNNFTFLYWCLGSADKVDHNGTRCLTRDTYPAGSTFTLDRSKDNTGLELYAVWSPNILVRATNHVTEIRLNNTICSINVDEYASDPGCLVSGLEYGKSYQLTASTIEEGFSFARWDLETDKGEINNGQFIVGDGPNVITPITTPKEHTIILDNTGATSSPYSVEVNINHGATSIPDSVVSPVKKAFTIQSFSTDYNNANGATVSSTDPISNYYDFNGWWTTSVGGNMVIEPTNIFVPNVSPYTGTNGITGKWIYDGDATFHARWDNTATKIRLPEITKTDYTCGWSHSNNTTTIEYQSGQPNVTLSSDIGVLYGVCLYDTSEVAIRFDSNAISKVVFTDPGGSQQTITRSDSVVLARDMRYSIAATLKNNYAIDGWALNDPSYGTLTTDPVTFTPNHNSRNAVITINTSSLISEYIQNLDPDLCTTTPMEVKDIRDNQIYTVQRLADGQCWMMNNLNLGDTDNYPLQVDSLNSSNTNISEPIGGDTFNFWKKQSTTTSSTYAYSLGEYIPIHNDNSTTGSDTDPTSGTKYGTLYNYYAASGETIMGTSNTENAEHDICPAGWRLPTGGSSSGDYYRLINNSAYNTAAKMRAPISDGGAAFARAGYFSVTSRYYVPKYQNQYGYYWSSTRNNEKKMNGLTITASSVSIGSRDRGDGLSIRCVLKVDNINKISTLQDFNLLTDVDKAAVINSMVEQTNYTLIDTRDNQEYTVAKLADGRVWMTQNLNLGAVDLVQDLDSTNTSIIEPVSIATFNSWKRESATQSYTVPEIIPITNDNSATGSDTDPTSGTKYGTLYNSCAAHGGDPTLCVVQISSTYTGGVTICPAGWRIPKVLSPNEIGGLYSKYGTALRTPVADGGAAIALAGRFESGAPRNQGSYGYYWGSELLLPSEEYFYLVGEGGGYTTITYRHEYGMSVRCILKN